MDTLNLSYNIGDTLTLDPDNEDLEDTMDQTTFTVVGVVHDPYYFSYEREPASVGSGTVQVVLYAPAAAFANDTYTEIYLTVDGAADLLSFDKEYSTLVDSVADKVEAIEDVRCQARYDQVVSDAQEDIDEGWQEYYDAKAEADQELADAAQELEDGRQELADGEKEYQDGEQEYADGLAEVQENESLLADGEQQLEDGRKQLADAQAEYDAGVAQLSGAEQQLADGHARLADAQRQYDEGLKQYQDGLAEFEAGKKKYEDGLALYEEGKKAYDDGMARYQEGEEQYSQLQLLNKAYNGVQTGIAQIIASGQASSEEEAKALFSDESIAGLQAQLDDLSGLKALYDAREAAKSAYEEALAQQPDPDPDPPATGETAAGTGQATPESGTDPQDPGISEEQLEQLRQAYEAAQQAWLQALQAAAAQMGYEIDITNPVMVAAAESLILPKLEQQETLQAQLDQLKQLNTAQKGLDAGIAAMMDKGTVSTEEEAIALFDDDGLAATRAALDAAKAELDENGPVLEATRQQLEQSAKTIAESERQLAAAKAELDAGKAELDAGWAEYNAQGQTFYDYKRQVEDGKKELDEGWATLTDRQVELDDAKQQIADAYAELADARKELDDALQTIEENKQKLADGEIDYEEGKAEAEQELADARTELEDAQADLDAVEFPSWYVWDRDNNVSYNSFAGNVSKVEALSGVFPLFFFLVAALVVSTTMTRMVEEERLQIGTMKALGFDNRAIMRKYILYAMTAAVSGALFGLAVGFTVFPSVIWYAYAMMYYLPAFHPVWRWNYAIFSAGSLILCTLLVTVETGRTSLKESPAALMRPRAPKAGKRILLERIRPLWNRMSFTYKVTFRNLFRYKRRFWMTVIGVAGCTALLLTGFGISDSINGIIVKQFTDVSQYDLITAVTGSQDTQSGPVYDYLFGEDGSGEVTSSLAAMTEVTTQELPDGSTAEVYLMVPQDADSLNTYIDMHERVSRKPTPLGETGIIMTEKIAELLDVKAGDTVTLVDGDGKSGQFTVSGVCENYVSNYIYMSASTYTDAFGDAPEWNSILSILSDDSQEARDKVSETLLGMDEVASLNFTADTMTQVLNMLNSINAVVVMIVVCAAVLALVVLYNLTNINVAERVKEIATIKVLGFYDREVSAYVMRETVALTIIGALFGLAGGIALHRFVIFTVEVDAVMFGRTIDPSSYVYALGLTMLFSLIVNLMMSRKLKKISMVESMKAPE